MQSAFGFDTLQQASYLSPPYLRNNSTYVIRLRGLHVVMHMRGLEQYLSRRKTSRTHGELGVEARRIP